MVFIIKRPPAVELFWEWLYAGIHGRKYRGDQSRGHICMEIRITVRDLYLELGIRI